MVIEFINDTLVNAVYRSMGGINGRAIIRQTIKQGSFVVVRYQRLVVTVL